jgi:hypothetical protein
LSSRDAALIGYRRFEGLEAAAALATLYRSLRLFVNYFQPSFKLAGKVREDARVKKHYHAPATPYQRLLADPRTPDLVRGKVQAVYATLDPVRLLNDIRQAPGTACRNRGSPYRRGGC